ncbi:hypothetical protein HDV62DRAFT_244614 [Trichoderma sp. SZMC 28011]
MADRRLLVRFHASLTLHCCAAVLYAFCKLLAPLMALMPVQFAAVLCCTAVQALTVYDGLFSSFFLPSLHLVTQTRVYADSSVAVLVNRPICAANFPLPSPQASDRSWRKTAEGDPPKTDKQAKTKKKKASARWRNDLQASLNPLALPGISWLLVGGLQENTRPEPHSTLDDEQGRADTRPGLNPCPDGPWRTIFLRIAGSACGGGRSLFLLRL